MKTKDKTQEQVVRYENKGYEMKTVKITLILVFLSVLGFIVYRSFAKAGKNSYRTTTLQQRNINENIFIPGNVFPSKEIEIKSQLSGILENIYVKIGDHISAGTPVASIQLVPSTSDIERLESNVNIARIEYNTRTVEYERAKRLFASQTISKVEMDERTRIYLITKENLTSAENQLDILKKGRIASKNISNIVKSSTSGTVIDIPLETGASVIERNNYNPGSTIAIVAETGLYKFRTLIAEHYLKYVSLGDTVTLTFSAYDDFTAKATVIKISSKGNPENGIMKYMLEAEFVITDDMPVLRSGYSATAEILLNSRDDALSVEEKHVVYRNDSTYLYVLEEPGKEPVKKNVTLGVSDGVYTEIAEGVNPGDKIVTNHDKID
ncbi:MAG: efflux RND transporter periplasmic adaptor subunit [Tannerella sp.]|jgi:HlyD family secretion protein|nr:efflux RND transporter periplasmic adaptor subunit [Tannerella sp.]